MGFNTVAFVLNDFMGERADSFSNGLRGSPKTLVDCIVYGYSANSAEAKRFAIQNGEMPLHSQALEVHSFHADQTQWYRAGQNCIEALKFVGYTKRDGRPCVILEIPEWAAPNR